MFYRLIKNKLCQVTQIYKYKCKYKCILRKGILNILSYYCYLIYMAPFSTAILSVLCVASVFPGFHRRKVVIFIFSYLLVFLFSIYIYIGERWKHCHDQTTIIWLGVSTYDFITLPAPVEVSSYKTKRISSSRQSPKKRHTFKRREPNFEALQIRDSGVF